jgi:purine-binding chemotaxis protein CheW
VTIEVRPDPGLSNEELNRILKERAEALAKVPAETPENLLHVLRVEIAGETYAVDVALVREVRQVDRITPVPGVPPHVAGVINLRGEILAVLDVRPIFELEARGRQGAVIVLNVAGRSVGLLADSAVRVLRLPADTVGPPLSTFTGARAEYVKGVASDGTVMLDAERLAQDPRLLVEH